MAATTLAPAEASKQKAELARNPSFKPHNLTPTATITNPFHGAGNMAIQRKAAGSDYLHAPSVLGGTGMGSSWGGVIQAKLTVNQPGDPYEQEADRVAEQVMRMADSGVTAGGAATGQFQGVGVQRMCAECDEERHQQIPKILRMCSKCEEESHGLAPDEEKRIVQAKGSSGQSPEVAAGAQGAVDAVRSGGGEPLPATVRTLFEPRFGYDFSQVRVHTDARASQSARDLNALAYTAGRDVVFGAGQFAPGTTPGDRLLAHELTHVIQQSEGPAARAVGRESPTPVVQRLTAEEEEEGEKEENLRSPKFAGNPRLERAFDNSPAIHIGESGEAVRLIQEALVDDGFLMPGSTKLTGELDGQFGQETFDVVKQFQDKHGVDVDGIVGRETLRQMDELEAAKAVRPSPGPETPSEIPLPDAEPPEQPTAPPATTTPEQRQGTAAPEQAPEQCLSQAEVVSTLSDGQLAFQGGEVLAAGPDSPQGMHLSIGEAVAAFHERVDVRDRPVNVNLSQTGQFFFTRQLRPLVVQELDRIKTAGGTDPNVKTFREQGDVALSVISDRDGDKRRQAFETAIGRMLDATRKTKRRDLQPAMLDLLEQQGSPEALQRKWFREINKTDQAPDLMPFRSLLTLKSLVDLSRGDCGDFVAHVAERIKGKQGITGKGVRGPGFRGATLSTGQGCQDRRRLEIVSSSPRMLGDLVEQTGVAATVAELKRALDAGHIVHARVISGVGVGIAKEVTKFDPPDKKPRKVAIPTFGEHSLLIIGFESDIFVFHDPDATTSSTPEPGFGLLFHDKQAAAASDPSCPLRGGDRLSTAITGGDLFVDQDGDHFRGDHRYQVTLLAPA